MLGKLATLVEGLPEITYDCPSSTVSRQMGDFLERIWQTSE